VKLRITARFSLGAILLFGGLGAAVYVFETDLFPTVMAAHDSGIDLPVSFSMMLRGVAPLAVAFLGFRLIRSGSRKAASDE